MGPPQRFAFLAPGKERAEIGDHEQKNEQRDEAGFPGHGAQPLGTDHQAAESESGDGNGYQNAENRRDGEVELSEKAIAGDEVEAHALGKMVDGDERECAESPEDKSMRKAGQRALPDDFSLQQDFPNEVTDTAPHGLDAELGIFFREQHG